MWTRWEAMTREKGTLELLLRVGVGGCFIGHGAFGVMGKAAWLPYFAVIGIGEELAWVLMPVVGVVDVFVGIAVLVSPRPILLFYAAGWALWTALLRPLAGESGFEALERAGNYGVPLALLVLAGVSSMSWRAWLRPLEIRPWTSRRRRDVALVLRGTVVALLVGHGGLALAGKALLVEHAAGVGLPPEAVTLAGVLELALAVVVAIRPLPGVLLAIVGWKVATEALYPLSGSPFWEFVERAGSYVAPWGLWVLTRNTRPSLVPSPTGVRGGAAVAVAVLLVGSAASVGPDARGSESSPGRGVEADTLLLERLRAGGHVLACRHAITDRSRGDAPRVDFSDPSTQRVLSEAGRAQARRLGTILRALGVPVGEVFTSPYERTAASAELTFGEAEVHDALYGGGGEKGPALRALLVRPPAPGTNRALMTHQGILYRMLPGVQRGSIREGDCVVVHPEGGGDFRVVARLGPDEWEALRPTARGRGLGPRSLAAGSAVLRSLPEASLRAQDAAVERAIASAREGGVVVVCRHAITGSMREVEPVDYDDPSTQRLLSEEGEEQALAMGRAFRALGVELAEVVASPMRRARRTAELIAERAPRIDGVWHTNGGDYGGPARDARAAHLGEPVPRGVRLIVSHIGTMSSVLDGIGGRVEEGDCVVVRPGAGGYELVGVVPWRAWIARLAGPANRERSGNARIAPGLASEGRAA